MILDALAFPFRRDNAIFLAIGAAMCTVPPVVAVMLPALPYVDIIALVVEGLVLCYALIYFHAVLEASTRGDEQLPMWPEEADLQSLAGKAFHVIIPLAVSFMPLIALQVGWVFKTGTWSMSAPALTAAGALAVLGAVYLPMALLVFSFYGETAVLNVVGVARSIWRIGPAYFGVVGLLAGLFAAHGLVSVALLKLPLMLALPLAALLFFYVMLAAMRAVGLMYARYRERLGWEDR